MRTETKVEIGAGVLAVASAVAATAWREYDNREIVSAELPETGHIIQRLYDIAYDRGKLRYIQERLHKEWGPFGPRDMEGMAMMARNAGKTTYIISKYDGKNVGTPEGALQTIVADVGGDPDRLVEQFPTWNDLTSYGTWENARNMKGDTVVLLQITRLGDDNGVGAILRNGALNMLLPGIEYGITTTPTDGQDDLTKINFDDQKSYAGAMTFHMRGGAKPTGLKENYKIPPEDRDEENGHSTHIAFMRYSRINRIWEDVKKPGMTYHFMGPLQSEAYHATQQVIAPLQQRLADSAHRFRTSLPRIARIPTYSFLHAR